MSGAASSIGAETARQFAAAGASVIIADVDEEPGENVVNEIEAEGGDAVFITTNVTEMSDLETMVETAVDGMLAEASPFRAGSER